MENKTKIPHSHTVRTVPKYKAQIAHM